MYCAETKNTKEIYEKGKVGLKLWTIWQISAIIVHWSHTIKQLIDR